MTAKEQVAMEASPYDAAEEAAGSLEQTALKRR
jgi:hypothetical protein